MAAVAAGTTNNQSHRNKAANRKRRRNQLLYKECRRRRTWSIAARHPPLNLFCYTSVTFWLAEGIVLHRADTFEVGGRGDARHEGGRLNRRVERFFSTRRHFQETLLWFEKCHLQTTNQLSEFMSVQTSTSAGHTVKTAGDFQSKSCISCQIFMSGTCGSL